MKLQALIDMKKVIITKDTIRQNLRLDDADGIDCLPNEEIFAELARMGYEKPSTKLTFYMAFFSTQWKFLIHTIVQYMRRIGKGFSGVDTPLFDNMLVQQQVHDDAEVQEDEDDNEVSAVPTLPSPKPATTPPPPQQEHIPSPPQAQSVQPLSLPPQQPSQTAAFIESLMTLLNKLMETCATLTQQVANLEQDKITQALEITKLKQREDASKQGGIAELDDDEDVTLVDVDAEVEMDANIQGRMAESHVKAYNLDLQHSKKVLSMQDTDERSEKQDNSVMRYQALKRKPVTKAQARKNMMIYLKNMAGFNMDFFKEELKRHLQIVANDDDDVYTEATPLASKVPLSNSSQKQQTLLQDNQSRWNSQVILKLHYFIEEFNTEDLEILWKLVKERFESTEPKNFSDDFLLNIFKIMFEKPNVEANVWRDQKGIYGLAKVKSWKLFESCGVHIITFTTTQMIRLVEKKYPLTHFTLEQMLNNVRLEVEKRVKCHWSC
nr:hypothetical protein [Tanacetum cinerariifolium]